MHALLETTNSPECHPEEIALKSFFLGPQAENGPWVADLLASVFDRWVQWRKEFHPEDGQAISPENQNSAEFKKRRLNFEATVGELLKRFETEVPKFSPRYVGHMFSEISLPALMGHIVALLHNPNNISGESSRVGIQIEDEAVRHLLTMVGFSQDHGAGHFTSGGTVANFEALIRAQARYALWLSVGAALNEKLKNSTLNVFAAAHMGWSKFDNTVSELKHLGVSENDILSWRSGRENPFRFSQKISKAAANEYLGPVILVPENKHYSWKKGCQFLGLGSEAIWPIQLDQHGTTDIASLEKQLSRAERENRPVLLVVSVVGTTELGSIDPVDQVQSVLDRLCTEKGTHVWHHVDAAYGGFFRTLTSDSERSNHSVLSQHSFSALNAIPKVDSITLDPHKLGYVPYASGAFLNRQKRDYFFSAFDDAPYIDFDKTIDRGPFTLEGSRSAAGAVATWMTAKTMGLNPAGYGLLLERTIRVRKALASRLAEQHLDIQIAPGCDTNVLCFSVAKKGEPISESNRRTMKVFEQFSHKKNGEFIVSKTALTWKCYGAYLDTWTSSWHAKHDANELVLIRMCMMNPFFESIETNVDYAEHFIECLGMAYQT